MNSCLLHFLRFLVRSRFLFSDFEAHGMCFTDVAEFAKIAYFLTYGDP
jgi:hypothetical protein